LIEQKISLLPSKPKGEKRMTQQLVKARAMTTMINSNEIVPVEKTVYLKVHSNQSLPKELKIMFLFETEDKIFYQVKDGTGWYEKLNKSLWTLRYQESFEFQMAEESYGGVLLKEVDKAIEEATKRVQEHDNKLLQEFQDALKQDIPTIE